MVYIPVGVNVNDGTVRRENDRETDDQISLTSLLF